MAKTNARLDEARRETHSLLNWLGTRTDNPEKRYVSAYALAVENEKIIRLLREESTSAELHAQIVIFSKVDVAMRALDLQLISSPVPSEWDRFRVVRLRAPYYPDFGIYGVMAKIEYSTKPISTEEDLANGFILCECEPEIPQHVETETEAVTLRYPLIP